MNGYYIRLGRTITAVSDLVCVNFSIVALILIKNPEFIAETRYFVLILVVNIALVFANLLRAGDLNHRVGSYPSDLTEIVRKILILLGIATTFSFLVKSAEYSRLVIFGSVMLFGISSTAVRFAVTRVPRGLINRKAYTAMTLFVGAGDVLEQLCDDVDNIEGRPIHVLRLKVENKGPGQDDPQLIKTLDDLLAILERETVNWMIVALPVEEWDRFEPILAVAERHGVRTEIALEFKHQQVFGMRAHKIGERVVLTMHDLPLDDPNNVIVRRGLDLALSAAVLVAFSCLYLLVAVVTKLDSPGPVFFLAERAGRHNKPFKCIKFRTMKVSSEGVTTTRSTRRNDERITSLGRILRRTNLDELPQFLNILKGEMSIVRPRPHRLQLNRQMQAELDHYMMRHFHRPGFTGWAQVRGLRGTMADPVHRRLRTAHDLWYMQNWSLFLDIKIISLTVFSRAAWRNAY